MLNVIMVFLSYHNSSWSVKLLFRGHTFYKMALLRDKVNLGYTNHISIENGVINICTVNKCSFWDGIEFQIKLSQLLDRYSL